MKPTSDHRHALVIPSREPRTDRPDGKQFLCWSCSCGLKRAGNLLTKEEIDEIAKQYKQRKRDSDGKEQDGQTPK